MRSRPEWALDTGEGLFVRVNPGEATVRMELSREGVRRAIARGMNVRHYAVLLDDRFRAHLVELKEEDLSWI